MQGHEEVQLFNLGEKLSWTDRHFSTRLKHRELSELANTVQGSQKRREYLTETNANTMTACKATQNIFNSKSNQVI